MNQEDFLILEERKVSRKLKHAKYDQNKDSYPFKFLLRNTKTSLVIELNGYSMMHVCNMAGWRVRDAEMLEKTVLKQGK